MRVPDKRELWRLIYQDDHPEATPAEIEAMVEDNFTEAEKLKKSITN
jgi:hypothetical protein